MTEYQKWLVDMIYQYNDNPTLALEEMLTETTNVIEQYINSKDSLASKDLLKICMECNKLFLTHLNK